METTHSPITPMTDEAAWEMLAARDFGRLAILAAGEIEIFPVNYVVHEDALYIRTAEGTKLLAVVMGGPLALETDQIQVNRARSVVVKGTAEMLDHEADIEFAESLPLTPWVATVKQRFIKITITQISGREFVLGPEPDAEQDAS